MTEFLNQSIKEYEQHTDNREKFINASRRIVNLVRTAGEPSDDVALLLLTPMIEIAWADGRVGRAEQNAILEAADAFGLLKHQSNGLVVMDRLSTRPSSAELSTWWSDLGNSLDFMPIGQTLAVISLLLEQSRYIAGLGQKEVYGLWRGYKAGEDERVGLGVVEQRLGRLNDGRLRKAELPSPAAASHPDDCLTVLPLIKVAWADGRITKRERQLIFDSLFDLGVEPTNDNLQMLLKWLELKPEDDFFEASMSKLRSGLEKLDRDARSDKKYSLLSQCTLVAEASGGDTDDASGGAKICREEVETVKHIARLLSGAIERNRG
ncbi:MAG: TerB family tellurite resistance protein [Pyrinomonadaceae bacterium]|nr:TerB family tellurite resistance protein [Pyrinomonadaceae bacterium]